MDEDKIQELEEIIDSIKRPRTYRNAPSSVAIAEFMEQELSNKNDDCSKLCLKLLKSDGSSHAKLKAKLVEKKKSLARASIQKQEGLYINEIRSMMHGFGDIKCPLKKSAAAVERIVLQEMTELLRQAASNARLRGSTSIGHEDILFLLRKDKMKLRRLLKHLELKDMTSEITKFGPIFPDEDCKIKKKGPGKRVKLCMDFLEEIAINEEYSNLLSKKILDPVDLERKMRCAENTETMTADEYLDYSVARQASFVGVRRKKAVIFRNWILHSNPTNMEPTSFAFELINYMVHETVAQIVDLALLVKRDRDPDKLERLKPPKMFHTDCLSVCSEDSESSTHSDPVDPEQKELGPDKADSDIMDTPLVVKKFIPCSPSSYQPSETSSPSPSSPPDCSCTSPSSSTSQCPSTSCFAYPSPALSMTCTVEPDVFQEKSDIPIRKCTTEHSPFDPITPSEINEVMRRYSQPLGPFFLFSRVYHKKLVKHLLCC